MQIGRRRFLHLVGSVAALTVASRIARAQQFPARPITMVVPYPAGGPADAIARIVGERMRVSLGQPVIVENLSGAGGTIGMAVVAKANPDGYTILVHSSSYTVTPTTYPNAPYDTLRDFAPITLIVRNTTILVVRADLPLNSAGELAAWAKEKPGEIAFASTGIGSMPHLALELFQSAGNVKFLHVPYRGAAPALTDLLGGQVQALFADAPVLLPQIDGDAAQVLVLVEQALERLDQPFVVRRPADQQVKLARQLAHERDVAARGHLGLAGLAGGGARREVEVLVLVFGRPLQHLVWTDPADDAEGWHIARRARLDLHDVE